MKPERAPFYHIDGMELPSVGMVLSVLAKPALTDWKVKKAVQMVMEDPERFTVPDAVLEALKSSDAMERGAAIHELAEDYANNVYGRPDGDAQKAKYASDPYFPLVDGFFEFYRPKVICTEAVVYNPTLGYAGTCDLIAELGHNPKTYLVDYKTSRDVYPEHRLQLAAYAGAERLYSASGPPADMPPVQATGVVLLRPGGATGFVEVHHNTAEFADDFDAFKNLLSVWKWKQRRR